MQPIYIEISDEITTVIERMKASDSKKIALVIPKGALLLQSIVNLKLAKKAANDSKKELVLVTTDTIGRNLASQVGIAFVTRLDGIEDESTEPLPATDGSEPHVIAGVKIHRYYENKDDEKAVDVGDMSLQSNPIIPREILIDVTPSPLKEEVLDEFSPIVIRQISTTEPATDRKLVEVISPRKNIPIPPMNPPTVTSSNTIKKQTNGRRIGFRIFGTLLFLCILAALTAIGVGAFYLPKTAVTIHLAPLPYSKDVTVIAKVGTAPSTADSVLTLGAQTLNAGDSATIPFTSTGSKDIGSVAKGKTTIFNSYSGTPQILPAGSQLKANGLFFTTDTAVTVPGAVVQAGQPVAGSTSVPITAVASGTDSNVSNVTGSVIALGTNLYCQIVATSGGDSKKLQVVTQTDIANAKVDLLKKLQDDAVKKLADIMKGQDLLLTPNSADFTLTSFSPSIPSGTEAAGGQVTGTATITQVVVDKKAVKDAVSTYLYSIQDPSHTLTLTGISTKDIAQSQNTLTLHISSTGNLTSSIPLDSIQSQLVGKSTENGIKLIRLIVKDANAINVVQTPTWWPNKSFPFSNKYLTVSVSRE